MNTVVCLQVWSGTEHCYLSSGMKWYCSLLFVLRYEVVVVLPTVICPQVWSGTEHCCLSTGMKWYWTLLFVLRYEVVLITAICPQVWSGTEHCYLLWMLLLDFSFEPVLTLLLAFSFEPVLTLLFAFRFDSVLNSAISLEVWTGTELCFFRYGLILNCAVCFHKNWYWTVLFIFR